MSGKVFSSFFPHSLPPQPHKFVQPEYKFFSFSTLQPNSCKSLPCSISRFFFVLAFLLDERIFIFPFSEASSCYEPVLFNRFLLVYRVPQLENSTLPSLSLIKIHSEERTPSFETEIISSPIYFPPSRATETLHHLPSMRSLTPNKSINRKNVSLSFLSSLLFSCLKPNLACKEKP